LTGRELLAKRLNPARVCFLVLLRLPGVAFTWYAVINVPTKRARWKTSAPRRKKNAKVVILRAFLADEVPYDYLIAFRALVYEVGSGWQPQTALLHGAAAGGYNRDTGQACNSEEATVYQSWFNFIKL